MVNMIKKSYSKAREERATGVRYDVIDIIRLTRCKKVGKVYWGDMPVAGKVLIRR
jgi:hypothetical protein